MLIYIAQNALLLIKKIFIYKKCLNFANIFSKKLVKMLSKYFNINKYAINLKLDKQLLYKLIYNLKLIELEISKIYIKFDLVNEFIRLFKFFIKAFIFFVRKFNKNSHLYINYWSLNNVTIKN